MKTTVTVYAFGLWDLKEDRHLPVPLMATREAIERDGGQIMSIYFPRKRSKLRKWMRRVAITDHPMIRVQSDPVFRIAVFAASQE